MEAKMAIIVITIISSRRVKPWDLLPVFIFRPIERSSLRLRIDIENILTTPGVVLGIVLIGTQSPFGGVGHRIGRYASQKLQFLADSAVHIHTRSEERRVG